MVAITGLSVLRQKYGAAKSFYLCSNWPWQHLSRIQHPLALSTQHTSETPTLMLLNGKRDSEKIKKNKKIVKYQICWGETSIISGFCLSSPFLFSFFFYMYLCLLKAFAFQKWKNGSTKFSAFRDHISHPRDPTSFAWEHFAKWQSSNEMPAPHGRLGLAGVHEWCILG